MHKRLKLYDPLHKSNERMCVYMNVFANNKFSLLARHFGQQNSVSVIISNLSVARSLVSLVEC